MDRDCSEAEQNRELSANAIGQRRAAIGEQALRKLVNFRSFEVAEKAVTENIDVLERLSDRDPAQVQMLQKLTRALQDLQEGVQATMRMVLDRCKMREVISV